MRILIKDLQPDQLYAVQFRAKTATQESEWSQRMTFSTSADVLGPAAVAGLSVTAQGTAFLATWNKVLLNTDGSVLSDFKDYEVVVTSGVTSVTYFTSTNRFDFTFEMNKSAFGTPAQTVTISVRARDLALNAVAVGTSQTATNTTPGVPTGFVSQPVINGINFNWNKVSDSDLKYYRLYKGDSAGTVTNLVYEGLSTNFTYSSLNFISNEYFKLAAVDVFGQETFAATTISQSPLSYDTEPPGPPTWPTFWFNTETDLSNRNARRVNVTLNWDANPESDIGSYVVQYKKTTDSVWSEVVVSGTATLEPAPTTKINGLEGGTNYSIRVAARNRSGSTSEFTNSPTQLSTGSDSTIPAVPSTPVVSPYIGQLLVTWDGLNFVGDIMDSDTERVEIHVSTVSGFTPTSTTMKSYFTSAYSGKPQSDILSGLNYDTTYYIKLVAVDYSQNTSVASSQAIGIPVKANEGDIASVNAGSITTGELSAGTRIIAGPELGTHAELTSSGLRVYAQDELDNIPNEVIRLGTDTNDYLAITSGTGEYVASIDDTGRIAGQSVEVAGYDSNGDGVKDAGLVVYGRDFSEWDKEKSRGFVAIGSYPSVAQFGPVVTEYGLFELSFDAQENRLYEIWAGPLSFSGSQAPTSLVLTLRFTTDGTAPTITSPILSSSPWPIHIASTGEISTTGYMRVAGTFGTGLHRLLLTVRRSYGTGVVYAFTNTSNVFYFSVSDMGSWAESTMVRNTGGGTYSGGGGSAPPPVVKKTYVQTYAATWSRAFKGDGTVRTDIGTQEIVQGYQGSNGNQKSMVGGFLRGGGSISPLNDISGSTISKIEVYLYANHWYNNSGGTAVFGVHSASSVPGSFSSSGTLLVSGWPKPGGRWVTLPSAWYPAFLTGGNRGITIGPGPSTSTLYYGRFNGPGKGGSTIPLMRITYVK